MAKLLVCPWLGDWHVVIFLAFWSFYTPSALALALCHLACWLAFVFCHVEIFPLSSSLPEALCFCYISLFIFILFFTILVWLWGLRPPFAFFLLHFCGLSLPSSLPFLALVMCHVECLALAIPTSVFNFCWWMHVASSLTFFCHFPTNLLPMFPFFLLHFGVLFSFTFCFCFRLSSLAAKGLHLHSIFCDFG